MQLGFFFNRLLVTAETLSDAVGGRVELVWTDNISTMLSVRRDPAAVRIRLHRMFETVDRPVFDALARYCRTSRGDFSGLDRHIANHRHLIRRLTEAERPGRDEARGEHVDLYPHLERIHGRYFADLPVPGVLWGRRSDGRRRIQLAAYDGHTNRVRVNSRLDRPLVPGLVFEFLMYHELCHARCIAEAREQGRSDGHHHHRRFRSLEKLFPVYDEVLAWEKLHLGKL